VLSPTAVEGTPRLVIADFGVSKLYADDAEGYTARVASAAFDPSSPRHAAKAHLAASRRISPHLA
jgi:hypothetical protein